MTLREFTINDAPTILILLVMVTFYVAYFVKQAQQRKQGVKTMILGKGDKPKSEKNIERALKFLSFLLPCVEIVSIYMNVEEMPLWAQWTGTGIAVLGVCFFCAGMMTMKDSWRAGIPETKETSLVTSGIYQFSRNPAFVGFDLLYLGILLAYPNVWHACAVAAAICLFHLQILGEEKFLTRTFGEEYVQYAKHVNRYLGRKK